MAYGYRSCAVLWLTFGIASGTATAEEPARITTDSADYCVELELRLTAEENTISGPLATTVRLQSDTGQKLCEEGQIRPGIAHLRSALRMIHQAQNHPVSAGP